MPIEILIDGPQRADTQLILAHGAGQGMDSPFMTQVARQLSKGGLGVIRFNFPYMQESVITGKKRPPEREPKLLEHWRKIINDVRSTHSGRLWIGGKSMGGRMASLIADELQVDGLVCLGYPFHPPGKPQRLRTQHLVELQTPSLICQGERDTFGKHEEIKNYILSPHINFHWVKDGDHSFKPRKASGLTLEQNLASACKAVLDFISGST